MKYATKVDSYKRDMRLKEKKSHNQKMGYGMKHSPASSIQKAREEIEPEGEQKRIKETKKK